MRTPCRYTSPVPRTAATSPVAAVYGQIAADFVLADGALMSLLTAPDLLAAAWILLRESQVAGLAPRGDAGAVAAAVSAANHCRFCADAHVALVIRLAAFGAMAAVGRIEHWVATASPAPSSSRAAA